MDTLQIWQNSWFYGAIFLFFFALAIAFHFWRIRSLIKRQAELEHEVKTRTDEFKVQKSKTDEIEIKLFRMQDEIKTISGIDTATGIANTQRFKAFLEHEWRRAMRLQNSIALALLQLDGVETYSATASSEEALALRKSIAHLLKHHCHRPGDLPAIYSEHIFAVALTDTTARGIIKLAEKIKSGYFKIKETMINPVRPVPQTISIGCCVAVPQLDEEADTLIASAADALTKAQQNGGSHIILNEL